MFDSDDIRAQARAMDALADALSDYANTVRDQDIDTWKGHAATAYRHWLDSCERGLRSAARDVDDLATALRHHAASVDASLPATLKDLAHGPIGTGVRAGLRAVL